MIKNFGSGDIVVMVTDGIIDSKEDIEKKELWLKDLLENIDTDNPQRIADIIIGEALDNGYGIAKDDMTVIVAKVTGQKGRGILTVILCNVYLYVQYHEAYIERLGYRKNCVNRFPSDLYNFSILY